MPNISIIKLKIRRGTDTQRKTVVLNQGELGYTIDTNRLFVGTGTLSGGLAASNKFLGVYSNYSTLSTINAQQGDTAVAKNILYALSGTDYSNIVNWKSIHPVYSNLFTYDVNNNVTIANNSLTFTQINSSIAGNGLQVSGGLLTLNVNPSYFDISGSQLVLASNSVSATNIASSTIGNGLQGGGGSQITLNVSPSSFGFNSGQLQLTAIPDNSIVYTSFNSNAIGDGLQLNGITTKLETILTDTDESTLTKDANGVVSMYEINVSDIDNDLATYYVDAFGRVISYRPTISTILTGGNTITGSFSHLGSPDQVTLSTVPPNATVIETLSSNGSSSITVYLSSAGFIAFNANVSSDAKTIDRFAIPIFSF